MMRCDTCGYFAFVSDCRRCVTSCPPRALPCEACATGTMRDDRPLTDAAEGDDEYLRSWEID